MTGVLELTRAERMQGAAWAVKTRARDITPWPELDWFNASPCAMHGTLEKGCQRCGIMLRRHQRIGVMWLYLAQKGLLSDVVGSGKTAQILAMLAICLANGEMDTDHRAVVVCKAAATGQWAEQVRRLLPRVPVYEAVGDPSERLAGYMGNWLIAIVSDRTFSPAAGKKDAGNGRDGDVAVLREFPVDILVYDDVDAMRNPRTKTAWAVNKLAEQCSRVVGVHGTPLQKRLPELWSFLQPVGGERRIGTLARVKQKYVQKEAKYFRQVAMVCALGHLTPQPNRRCDYPTDDRGGICGLPCTLDPTGQKVLRTLLMDGGVNPDTIGEFRMRIAPLVLRRTTADLDDVELPAVQYNPVHLDLLPEQRKRYNELRTGTLRRLREHGEEISFLEAQQVFIRGWQICSGTASLDGEHGDVSAKFDWVVDKLTGDLDGEKAVVFVYFKDNVAALSRRLAKEGIGHVVFWSGETDARERERRRQQFINDPACRVLIGTTTIEQSLNLQAAPHLIAVDTILNPARMEQLVGRVRRQGSAFGTVFFHHLLARGTQEDGYLPLLRREQDLADVVWEEDSEIFAALRPRQIMNLVARGSVLAAA
jgi:SNF2 family DNA or RNA helicase